jgi:DNA modification methylase
VKNSLQIIYVPAAAIKPSPYAARRHSSAQRRKLKAILQQFGQVVPLPLDAATGTLIDGHAVFDALVELGHDEIAVVRLENRSEAEVRALRLALNRVAQDAAWDDKKLRDEFEYLINVGFDLDLTGFATVEIDMALSIDAPTDTIVEEETLREIEPVAGPAVTRLGDVFHLGSHKIGCGDARDPAFIRALVADKTAMCVFTDPPYNMQIDGFAPGLGKAANHDFGMDTGETSGDPSAAFLSVTMAAFKPVLADGTILYFCCVDRRHGSELCEAAAENGLEQKDLCVWVKSIPGPGSLYRSQHELIFVFKHGEGPHQNNIGLGDRTRSNVWQYAGGVAFGKDRMDIVGVHPTVKPVAMIADALRDVSCRGDVVLDMFLGSGSTLIAAEETGRVCIGIELDPLYVDATIRRWQSLTGKNAVQAVTGTTFDAIAQRAMPPVATELSSADMVPAKLSVGPAASNVPVKADAPKPAIEATGAKDV